MSSLKQRDLRVAVTGTLKYYVPSPSSSTSTANVGVQDSCLSEYNKREDANPLSIYHIEKQIPFLNGQRFSSGGVLEREFIGYPIGNHTDAIPDPRTYFGTPSNAQLIEDAWTILSKTNPSQPHVSVPTALGELKDLPSLVKGWGDGLLKAAAKGNLSWRWAVKPMISDVRKLADFVNAANKRLAELRKLRDGKTLKKRCSLGTSTANDTRTRILIHSNGAALYGQRQNFHTYTKWGSCEWKLSPDSILPSLSDADLRRFNKRVMLGITSHGVLETAWELCPWSWFIDWFSNVGDLISATNNTVGCTWGRICVMRHSKSWRTYDFDPAGSATWPTFSGWYKLQMERKERWPTIPAVPFPLPSLPLLDGGKLSILLSLAALRR
jgi:hypothetical protein